MNYFLKDEITKIKKIIKENKDKRILILGTHCRKNYLLYKLESCEDYYKIYDQKLIETFGYIEPRYISEKEKNEIKEQIQIQPGKPMYSHHLLPSDLIIFLYFNKNLLKINAYLAGENYDNALATQNKIQESLRTTTIKTIKIKVQPQKINLENSKRVVYICGDLDNELSFTDKRSVDFAFITEDDLKIRFPFIKKVKTLEEIKRKQGFLLIISETLLPTNPIELDKKYRSFFKNFTFVYVITEDFKKQEKFHLNYSNIYYVDKNYFDDEILYQMLLDNLLTKKEPKITNNKRQILEKINNYLQNKKSFTTKELVDYFHLSIRQVERYLNDINRLYNTIGYDYQNKHWYYIK